MSTQPISGSTGTALPNTNGIQITGLASGLDTNAIISQLMTINRQPVVNLQNQQSGLQSLNTLLQTIQSSLQSMSLNASALGDPGLFANQQSVTSSNSNEVSVATTASSGIPIGSYQVQVQALATSAQRTFSFTSPSSPDTITIDGQTISLNAGAQAQDLVDAVNSNQNLDVWAVATNSNQVVFSERSTGHQSGSYIQVTDPGSVLSEQTQYANAGQDASYSLDGGSTWQGSSTNTVAGAIPGVTLTLNALTGSTPVTVNVGAPAPNASAITQAVTTFVNSYNAVINQVLAQTNTAPVPPSSSGQQATPAPLFGDQELTSLLGNMRTTMYTSGAGLPAGMASLADIGISTGAASGSSSPSQSSINGLLTVDSTALANAIQTNPNGVKQVLSSWAQSFTSIVNSVAQPGGTLDARIQGNNSEIGDITNQINDMNAALTDQQNALVQEFAQLEATLSTNQSITAQLTSQISQLPAISH